MGHIADAPSNAHGADCFDEDDDGSTYVLLMDGATLRELLLGLNEMGASRGMEAYVRWWGVLSADELPEGAQLVVLSSIVRHEEGV